MPGITTTAKCLSLTLGVGGVARSGDANHEKEEAADLGGTHEAPDRSDVQGRLGYPLTMTSEQRKLLGELINDELMERGWTLEDLASKSQLQALRIRELIAGNGPMTKVVALGFSNAFGTSMEFWLRLTSDSPKGAK